MESYIVRIVRRKDDTIGKHLVLDGVVESAEGNTRRPFHNADELWSILGGASKKKHRDCTPTNKKRR